MKPLTKQEKLDFIDHCIAVYDIPKNVNYDKPLGICSIAYMLHPVPANSDIVNCQYISHITFVNSIDPKVETLLGHWCDHHHCTTLDSRYYFLADREFFPTRIKFLEEVKQLVLEDKL